jgi:hypothetical protein
MGQRRQAEQPSLPVRGSREQTNIVLRRRSKTESSRMVRGAFSERPDAMRSQFRLVGVRR